MIIKILNDLLHEGIVNVEFEKKDGTIRVMNCTLNDYIISADQMPKGTGPEKNNDVMAVYSTDVNEWRSFRIANVKSFKFSFDAQ